jgi:hypothetical protein
VAVAFSADATPASSSTATPAAAAKPSGWSKARALAATPADAGDAHNALLAALKGNPRANMKRVQSKAALEMAAARASAAGADGAS